MRMEVVVDLTIVAVLFAVAVMLTYPRPRAWMAERGRAFVTRFGRPEHTPEWELEHAELWLMARRKQLIEDLRRIEFLIRHDETMSATRQLGNRLARDQLIASLARIPDVLPGRDRSTRYAAATSYAGATEPYESAAPSSALATRGPVVEVLDVGGWR